MQGDAPRARRRAPSARGTRPRRRRTCSRCGSARRSSRGPRGRRPRAPPRRRRSRRGRPARPPGSASISIRSCSPSTVVARRLRLDPFAAESTVYAALCKSAGRSRSTGWTTFSRRDGRTQERDTASERGPTWRLLVAMALASGITSVPNAAIVLALPTLHREFDASTTMLQWTVTGYLLAYSSLLIAAGRLADLLGRRRVLMAGTVLFVAASVVGALADGAIMLIVALIVDRGRCGDPHAGLAGHRHRRVPRRAARRWRSAPGAPRLGAVLRDRPGDRRRLHRRAELALDPVAERDRRRGDPPRRARRRRPRAATRSGGTASTSLGLVCSVGALAGLTLALNETPAEWKLGIAADDRHARDRRRAARRLRHRRAAAARAARRPGDVRPAQPRGRRRSRCSS